MQCCTHTCSIEHSLSALWGVFSFLFLQFAIPCAKQSPSAGHASVVCQIILFLLLTYFSFVFNSPCCNSFIFVFYTCCNLDTGWVQKPVSHATNCLLYWLRQLIFLGCGVSYKHAFTAGENGSWCGGACLEAVNVEETFCWAVPFVRPISFEEYQYVKRALARFRLIRYPNTVDAHSYWHVCLKGDKWLKKEMLWELVL